MPLNKETKPNQTNQITLLRSLSEQYTRDRHELFIFTAIGKLVLLQHGLNIKLPMKIDILLNKETKSGI